MSYFSKFSVSSLVKGFELLIGRYPRILRKANEKSKAEDGEKPSHYKDLCCLAETAYFSQSYVKSNVDYLRLGEDRDTLVLIGR